MTTDRCQIYSVDDQLQRVGIKPRFVIAVKANLKAAALKLLAPNTVTVTGKVQTLHQRASTVDETKQRAA